MGRGQMSGGGASQLSYLFGSDSQDLQAPVNTNINKGGRARIAPVSESPPAMAPPPAAPSAQVSKDASSHNPTDSNSLSMGEGSNQSRTNVNNYHRADGQNVNNFLTDRPSKQSLSKLGYGSSINVSVRGTSKFVGSAGTRVVAAPGGNSQLNFLFGG